jgi:SAM-dependent methyltransferase
MLCLFLERRQPAVFAGSGKLLYFASEPMIRTLLEKNRDLRIVSTDYAKGIYSHVLRSVPSPRCVSDIQALPFSENSLDGALCLHVLEHVNDDRAGIHELFRVLRPGGMALIMVPFMMGQTETIEYPAPDPIFFFHVRGYSPRDFSERLTPFDYEAVHPADFLTPEEIASYQIPDSQVIFLCRKPMTSGD